jgi:hypothetical protein
MGNPLELGYLQETLKLRAQDLIPSGSELIVRSAEANEGQTFDGIAAGGERLASEVSRWIDQLLSSGQVQEISLSFVGNSLGGLYARYALATLDLDRVGVHPKVFCTTATPHLGVSQHTYVPIPRFMETLIASAIQSTGRDLFRVTNVLEQMTTDRRFILPLLRFQKRIAYANAYYTDFQVPSATAAFVAPDSDSPHFRLENPQPDFIAVAVATPQQLKSSETGNEIPSPRGGMSAKDISRRLDSLGWTKVFVDVRPHLFSVPLPLPFWREDFNKSEAREQYASSELHEAYCRVSSRLHFPLGHTVLVANSKNDIYAKLNAAGKPIMDQLAADLLRDILA